MSIFAFTYEQESDCLAEKEGADKEGRLSMLSYKQRDQCVEQRREIAHSPCQKTYTMVRSIVW